MAKRRVGWTLRVESRRDFLERTAAAAAWMTLAACAAKIGGGTDEVESDNSEPDAGDPEPGSAISELPGESIPAYGPVTPNERFYITSCCGNPSVDIESWTLSIKSRGTEVRSIDYASLRALPARDREHTLECIGAGPRYPAISNAIWTGLPLAEIFDALGVEVPAGTIELKFESADGYSTALPLADLERPVWLVWLMNGTELPLDHGYPVRALVPGRYGMKNPKWITSIDFIDTSYLGFWESNGWSNTAEYRTNTLVHDPQGLDDIPAGELVVVGTAFAGSQAIVAVEVSVDGADWAPATIDYAPGPDVWTVWHYDVELTPGTHTIQARCTLASGETSGPEPEGTNGLEGYDGSMQVELNVV